MGRPRSKHFQLPPRMHAKQRKNGVTFYYQPSTGSRTPIRLGGDLAEAKRKWAELEGLASAQTFGAISERYEREVIPTKAPGSTAAKRCAQNAAGGYQARVPLGTPE